MCRRLLAFGALALASLTLAACGDDASTPGVRGACGYAEGGGLECDDEPIASASDACWKMVDCGVIPVANPNDDENCCLDWAHCVEEIEGLDDTNQGLVLSCVETSSCDALKTDRSPEGPGRFENGLPLCFQHGNF